MNEVTHKFFVLLKIVELKETRDLVSDDLLM